MGWDEIFVSFFVSVFTSSLFNSVLHFVDNVWYDVRVVLTAFWNWVLGRWRPGCVACITFFIMRWEMNDAKLPRVTGYLYFFFFTLYLFLLPVLLSCICTVGIWVAVGILDQMISIELGWNPSVCYVFAVAQPCIQHLSWAKRATCRL